MATRAKKLSSTIQLPCLGRPFKPGMLYDCRNDNLILGVGEHMVWNASAIKKARKTDQADSDTHAGGDSAVVIENDTLKDKMEHLDIKGGLKLSVLPGSLVKNVSGSAAYLNDCKRSNKQARVCLKYSRPLKLTYLDMTKVGHASKPSVEATHVVTGVYYGANAIMVFDRHDCDEDNLRSIKQQMLDAIETLASNSDLDEEEILPDREEAAKYQCTVYADSQPVQRLSSFTEAVHKYRDLPQCLEGKLEPIVVQLYPLSELTSKPNEVKFVKEVSDSVATEVQEIFEALHMCKVTCSDIEQHPLCGKFSRFKTHIADFKKTISKFQTNTVQRIATVLPQIRSGKADENELLKDIGQSPFNPKCLTSFASQKQKELNKLESFTNQMQGIDFIPAGKNFESAVADYVNHDVVVCLAFNVISEQDLQLNSMKSYLKGRVPDPIPQKQNWHKDTTINQRMRKQIKQFVKLAKSNFGPKQKFIVTDHANEEAQPAAILISTCGSCLETFVPPSEPSQPFVKDSDISHDCITLSWTPPESGSEHVERYIVYSQSISNTPSTRQQWTKHKTSGPETSLKVTGLLSSTSYLFKVQAQCQFKLLSPESEYSDPFTTKEFIIEDSEEPQDSNSIESKVPQHPEATRLDVHLPPTSKYASIRPTKPQVSALSYDKVKVEWQLEAHDSEDNVKCYTVSYKSLVDPQKEWIQSEVNTLSTYTVVQGLNSCTKYIFKVKPICKIGIGIDSEVSDPVMTKFASSRPGKPQAMSVTPNCIQLQWEQPEHSGVDSYILMYRCTNDTDSKNWAKNVTEDAQPKAMVSKLQPNTSYCFKVRPMFYTDSVKGTDSELSDPIKTSEPVCKTSRPWANESVTTQNSITISWKKPEYINLKDIDFYIVSYRAQSASDKKRWEKKTTTKGEPSLRIDGLVPNTKYIFKVRPELRSDDVQGTDSDESAPIKTKPVCQSGKPIPTNVTHNSVELQWEIPEFGNNCINNYVVLYTLEKPNPSDKWDKCETIDSEPKHVVKGLQPNSNYTFRVQPKCTDIDSQLSEASDPIQTKPPVCQPGKPQAIAVTHNSVKLAWESPEYESDKVDFYIVSYGVHDNEESWTFINRATADNSPSIEINKLEPNKIYLFRVRPECRGKVVGVESEFSDPIKTNAQPYPPGKPMASAVTHNSVTLQWEKPKYYLESHDDTYTVLYCTANYHRVKEWNTISVEGNDTVTTVSSLLPNTQYFFKISLKLSDGSSIESEISDTIETMTLICKPGKPKATVINDSNSCICLEWNKPQYGYESIESYIVSYRNITNPSTLMKQQITTGRVEQLTVQDLLANNQYVFKVRPFCSTTDTSFKVIESEESDPIQVNSLDFKPSKPKPSTVTQDSITLHWEVPEYSDNTVQSYTVSYCTVEDKEKWNVEYVQTTSCVATIGNLQPNNQYFFKVLPKSESIALNCIESDISELITTKSLECRPGKPRVYTMESHNGVRLEWNKPQYGYESIESYIVSYRNITNPSTPMKQQITTGRVEQLTVQDLLANNQYVFKVRPFCNTSDMSLKVIESEESDPIQVNSLDFKPSKPKPSTVTQDSITLHWEVPEYSDNTVQSYTVSYCTVEDKEKWNVEYVQTTSCVATIGNLQPNNQYFFKVLPKSESIALNCIESDISEPITTKSLECRPGKPRVYTIESHNGVRLEWNKPQYGYESIESYFVSYRNITNPSTPMKQQITTGRVEQLTVQDLLANNQYVFKVRPICNTSDVSLKVIDSEESDPIQVNSLDFKPSKPKPSTVTQDSITLHWEVPEYSDNTVQSYTVSYCTVEDKEKWNVECVQTTSCVATIGNLQPNSQYFFKVLPKSESIALNCIESDISEPITTKLLECRPGKPRVYTIESHNGVCLEWNKPQNGYESIESYIVSYRNITNPSTPMKQLITTGQVEKLTVQDLLANNQYVFKVRPICNTSDVSLKVIDSEESDPIQVNSLDFKPSKPKPSTVTQDSITLHWEVPEYSDNTVQSYTVSYCTVEDKEKWNVECVQTTSCVATIGNLQPNSQYFFKVLPKSESIALNCIESDISEPITTKLLECRPGKPRVYTIESHNGVCLEWNKPQYGYESIESYIVSYRNITNPSTPMKQLITTGQVEKLTVQDLLANNQYVFKVRPICNTSDVSLKVIDSEESDPIQVNSLDFKPSKPKPSTVTQDSITLHWEVPEYSDNTVQSYTVSYCTVEDKEKWNVEYVQTTSCVATIGNLQPNNQYFFKVLPKSESIALNCIESDISEPITTKSLECRPGKPRVYTMESHNGVRLEWNKPQYGYESIESYIVSYRNITNPSTPMKQLITTGRVEQLTVQDLLANNKYVFKVRPFCNTSDMSLKVIESEESDPIQVNSLDFKPSKPKPSTVTQDSITLHWEVPEYSDNTVQSYTVSYCTVEDKEKWNVECVQTTSCVATIGNLQPNNQYFFKVLPKSESIALNCIESDISEPITTKSLECRPGKPRVYTIESHNGVCLEWNKPQYGYESIESYIVSYRNITNPSTPMKQQITTGRVEQLTVQDLLANNQYVFKARPISNTSYVSLKVIDSEESDPIQVNSLDFKPSKPKPSTVTQDSITLHWEVPEYSDNTVQSYTVSYCTVEDKEKWNVECVQTTSCVATIGNLQPNSQYFFKVLPKSESIALNCIESDISEPITTKSLECRPGKPRVYYTTDIESHNSVRVEWNKPQYGYESIESYIVFCNEVGDHSKSGKKTKQFTNGKEEQATVSNLAVNKHYVFYVVPYGNISANSKFKFKESEESAPFQISSRPSKPEAIDITSDSIQLQWKMLGSRQDVEFYTVSFRLASDQPNKTKWRMQSTKIAETNFTVNELSPATCYIFRISATNKAGNTSDGEDSIPICTTNTSKPGKPTASEVSDATVLLTWTHPEVGQECINSYTIMYCQANNNPAHKQKWKTRPTDGFTNQLEMTPLAHDTKYLFKVHPECITGTSGCDSDVSDPIETNTTSEPSDIKLTDRTASAVELTWKKPKRGQESITSYDVYYREASSNQQWKKENAGTAQSLRISGLLPSQEYDFKVQPVCAVGMGTESHVVTIKTKQLFCKINEITVVQKKHNSVELKWTKPNYGNPTSYICSYRCVAENQWIPTEQNPDTEQIKILGLTPKTTYIFRVCPQMEDNGDVASKETDSEWVTTEDTPIAERLKEKCTKLDVPNSACDIYKIPVKKIWEGEKLNRIARYELDVDLAPPHFSPEKVIMLVGATGAGKSTLINGIVNYIFSVQYEDNFRFKLIHDENDQGQTQSQTSSVNAYTIHPLLGSRLDYTLTIIDTPGFGDTRGVEQDHELIGQIKDFFTHTSPDHKGIDHIHGVGLVVKNPEVRLTATQKYISSYILSIFGKDIKENIFLMVTFADGAAPPVLEAVKKAEIPYQEHFKFNNSALYPAAESNDPVALPMWNMGQESFKRFFSAFQKYKPKSLTLTRKVLEERERLESYVKTLREEIDKGVQEINKLQLLKEKLKAKEQNIDAFKEFKLTVTVTKQRKVDLSRGVYVTNCLKCNRTCHDKCAIPSDDQKYNCCVMMPHDQTTASCTVCEGKCHWTRHVNNPYRFEVYTESVEQTIDDLKKHHDEAKSGKLDVETMINDLEDGLDQLHIHVMSLVTNAQKSLARLGEIALKPNPPTNEGYIDMLIEEERREGRTGFEQRIATFEQLKKQAKIIRENVMSGQGGTATLDRQATYSGDQSSDKPKQKRWYHFVFNIPKTIQKMME